MEEKRKLLFIDDEKNVLNFFEELLSDEYEVITTNNGFKAINLITRYSPDIVFLDIIMPDIDGLETLRLIRERFKEQAVIMLTAVNDVKAAVTALRLGAKDYICKPFEIKELRVLINKTISELSFHKNFSLVNQNLLTLENEFIGTNDEMQSIISLVNKIADKDVTVMLQGETGTGKEVIARMIHRLSSRSQNNFVSVDCSAIPYTLLESELFGYEKGAFTGAVTKKIGRFESADSGTLFLDEIGNLPIEFQPKLLRAIQEGEIHRLGMESTIRINVRIIVATHHNLENSVANNLFREDLFYRLNVIKIELPPLRRRKDDIEGLLKFFIKKFSGKFNAPEKIYTAKLVNHLQNYDWPGNIREFQNLVERAIVMSGNSEKLTEDYFDLENKKNTSEMFSDINRLIDQDIPLKDAQNIFEREYILNALKKYGGSRKTTSEKLDIDRSYISKLISKYNIKI